MTNKEDLLFLESMKTDRIAVFGSFDKSLDAKLKRKNERLRNDELKKSKMLHAMQEVSATVTGENYSDHEESENESTELFNTNQAGRDGRNHHRAVRTGTNAFIPHDILKSPRLVSVTSRMNITPTQQAAMAKAIVEEAGGDPSKISLSYSTADRARRQVVRSESSTAKLNWSPPKFATLHWDSKLMPALSNKCTNEERLAILISTENEEKLLGVPSYKTGSNTTCGEVIASLTSDLLRSWQCTGSIINMAFDTTASNTSHLSAACVSIQDKVGRALLWSACRHHVGEVVLTHVFNDLKIETSKGPEVMVFTRFKRAFPDLSAGSFTNLSRLNPAVYSPEAIEQIEQMRAQALTLAMTEEQFCRDDYKEFAKLCAVYLSDTTEAYKFNQPGALHKARWMSKLIYSIKICLLESHIREMPQGTVTSGHQVSKIRKFVNFASLVYAPWWFSCTSAKDAPYNDLNLYKILLKYKVVDLSVATSALKAFQRHLWYLNGEMVPLSLFSDKVQNEEKKAIASSLLKLKPETECLAPCLRMGNGFGKPVFPSIYPTTSLAKLVTTDSWYFFKLLEINCDFLQVKEEEWSEHPSFISGLTRIQALTVVNDVAERGVKLGSDFISSAKTESHFQDLLQVVEKDRKTQPNLRKLACKSNE